MNGEARVAGLSMQLRRLFADGDGRWYFWPFAASVGGAVAVGKGLMVPNRWSATQAQTDYHFGFVKRGLFGQIFAGPLGLHHYSRFAVFSGLILLVFLALLVFYTWFSGVRSKLGSYQVAAVFFSSYGITYVANMIGYLDIVLGVLALSVLMIWNPKLRIAAAIPSVIVALLVHENFLLIFVPLLMLSFYLQWSGVRAGASERMSFTNMLSMVSVLALVGVVGTTWISLRPSLTPDQAMQMQARTASLVDFEVKQDSFFTMVRSAGDNAALMRAAYKTKWWWLENMISIAVFGPTLLILLLLTWRVVRESPMLPPGAGWACTLAALSPLSLHVLGADAARWNAWTVVTSYLVLLTVCRAAGGSRITLQPEWRNAMVLSIMLSMASGNLLLDSRADQLFPFIHDRFSLRNLKAAKITPPAL